MQTITYNLQTRQVVSGHNFNEASQEISFEERDETKSYFHRLNLTFEDHCSSYSTHIDFNFDNQEDYVEEEVNEDDENVLTFVGKQRTKEQYDIRYGDSGVCNKHIFADFINLIKTNSTAESQIGTISKFSKEAYNTIIGDLTYSNGKMIIDKYSFKITLENKDEIISKFQEIDLLILSTYYQYKFPKQNTIQIHTGFGTIDVPLSECKKYVDQCTN